VVWEQLESLDDKYQQEIGGLQWQIYNLQCDLEEARKNQKEATAGKV